MNLEELAQPTMPGQKPKTMKNRNITMVIVANAGDGAQIQLDGIHEHVHALKLQPGDRVKLDLFAPTTVRLIEG